jgi:hypothetical protein
MGHALACISSSQEVGTTSSRKASATRPTLNQVGIAAVLDRYSNAARRAHRPKSVTSDISA